VKQNLNETTKKNGFAVAEMTFANACLLKKLFEAINRPTDEPVFRISEDAIGIRQMDPSRVCMIDYSIGKAYFEMWNVHTPGDCCFNLGEALKAVFKKISKDTRVSIFVDSKDGNVTFTLKDSRVRQRTLPMLKPQSEKLPVPKLQFDATVKMVTKQLREDLEDIANISDHVVLKASPKEFVIEATGDIVKAKNTYEAESEALLNIQVTKECRAVYSLSYLTEALVDPNLCSVIALDFSENMPIRTTMFSDVGELYSWLAPRIECE